MINSVRFSYLFIGAVLAVACFLHMAVPLLAILFSYFALNKLCFGSNKWLAVVLFLALAVAFGMGASHFLKHAVHALPEIVGTAISEMVKLADRNGIDLPFTDYDSLLVFAQQTWAERAGGIGKYAKTLLVGLVAFIIGIISAVSLFLNPRFQLDPAARENLYTAAWVEIRKRFGFLYDSFSTVMGAQLAISAVNTVLTTVFLLWNDFPNTGVLIVVTFLCGLLPIIGNLISNALIVGVGLTLAPKMALFALIFLVALHKLEYLLNSKIVGHRIRNPMWLTLLGLIIGEKLMGIPGMVLAPVILHYIKVEASQYGVSVPTGEPPGPKAGT